MEFLARLRSAFELICPYHPSLKDIAMSDPVTLDPTQQAAIAAMQKAEDQAMYAQSLITAGQMKASVVLAAYNASDAVASKVNG